MIPSTEGARAVLMRLLEIGVYALVIYGALLAFGRAFRSKARPALRFGLWFLLLLRLTLPFTVTSAVHMIVLPAAEPAAAPAAAETEASAPPIRSATTAPSPQSADKPRATAVPREETAPQPSAVRLSLPQILWVVWIVGAAAFLLHRLWLWALLAVRLRDGAHRPDLRIEREFRALCRKMGVRRAVRIREVPDMTSPALTVGLRPTVLLPAALAGEDRAQARRFALLHELTHLKRGDHLVMLWYGALRCLWWFHPVLWLMEKPFRLDMESACDARAVRGLSREEKLSYAALLLELSGEGPL